MNPSIQKFTTPALIYDSPTTTIQRLAIFDTQLGQTAGRWCNSAILVASSNIHPTISKSTSANTRR